MKKLVVLGAVALAGIAVSAEFVVKVQPGMDLTRVRDEVRTAREGGRIKPGEAVAVVLAPGEYSVTRTLVLDEKDGGTAAAPVTWRAEKPGTAKLIGGRTIPASAFGPVTDTKRLASFAEGVRDKVRAADVSQILPGVLKPWPDAFHGMAPAPWLYQDGEPLEIARWPDKDWSSFTNVVDDGKSDDPKNEFAVRPGIFYLQNAPNAARWDLAEGVWCDGYWKHDWDEEILRLASYDPVKETAQPRAIHRWGLLGRGTCGPKARRFKVINVAAELDSPGEWWLDRAKKILYYLPVPGKEKAPVVLTTDAPEFLRVDGASWLVVEGLDFSYSHGRSSLVVTGPTASHVTIRNCTFSNVAGSAVTLGGRDCTLTGCRVDKTGSTAVCVNGGDRKNLVPAGNLVTNCEISRFGRFNRIACGVRVDGCGNALRDCNVHHGAAQSLCYGGNEHLFANNDFHHVLLESCDAGAVYTGYDPSSQGNLLFGNYTHELGDDPKLWPYRNGFYFDDCDWGDDVIGNRFYHTGRAIFIGSGNMHRVHNNLVVDALCGFHCDSRGVTWERRIRGSFLPDVEGHSWAEQGVLPFRYREAPWHVAYPEIAVLVDDRPNLPHSNPVVGNIFVNCKEPYSIDRLVKPLLDEMPVKGNSVLTVDDGSTLTKPPQPISFAEAERTVVKSPDGRVAAAFFLDVAGRLSWTADVDGRPVVARSTLGVTVGYRDFGKLSIPGKATVRQVKGAPVANMRDDSDFDVKVDATAYNEAEIPLRDLITGRTAAFLEVRAFNGGLAFRYRVPGTGTRRVYGEMTAWNMAGGKLAYRTRQANGMRTLYNEMGPWNSKDGVRTVVGDAERGDQPRFRLQKRGGETTGLVFPQAPRGWNVVGDVLTPWRVTLFPPVSSWESFSMASRSLLARKRTADSLRSFFRLCRSSNRRKGS